MDESLEVWHYRTGTEGINPYFHSKNVLSLLGQSAFSSCSKIYKDYEWSHEYKEIYASWSKENEQIQTKKENTSLTDY